MMGEVLNQVMQVETKTFELAVLRMVGSTRTGIISLLMIQAFSYALPAWVIGLSAAQGVFIYVVQYFKVSTGVPVSTRLVLSAIIVATALGILVPAISAVLPIRKALGFNLRDSLDKRSSKNKGVIIKLSRNTPGSLRGTEPMIFSGQVLTVFGFCIYYFLPKALLQNGTCNAYTRLKLAFQHIFRSNSRNVVWNGFAHDKLTALD